MIMVKILLKGENVLSSLFSRQISIGNKNKRNFKILKTLICKSNFSYKKVWETRSKKPVACEGSHIYFNNYRESYSRCGRDLKPVLNFQLSSDSFPFGKIEDALMCQTAVHPIQNGVSVTDSRNSLFCVTRDNWLVRLDLQNGRVLEKINLSRKCKYRSIKWDIQDHSLVLKSTINAASSDVLVSIAYFEVYPLKFVAQMEIKKSVFGPRVRNVSISQSLLIAMHSSGLVKMYSFHRILQQGCKTYQSPESSLDPEIIINLTEEPPLLFELRCFDHVIEIGGSPWHYLYSPPNKEGTFHIARLDSNKLIDVLNLELESIEPHQAIFHPDESGRIIHIANNILKVFEIKTKEDRSTQIEERFTITIRKSTDKKLVDDDFPCVTQSGRIVRKRISLEAVSDPEQHTIEVDYENDLDLLAVTSINSDSQGHFTEICIGFYDNITGELLRKTPIDLMEPCALLYEHSISVDLDTIVQRYKPNLGDFRCVVYRLKRDLTEDEVT